MLTINIFFKKMINFSNLVPAGRKSLKAKCIERFPSSLNFNFYIFKFLFKNSYIEF